MLKLQAILAEAKPKCFIQLLDHLQHIEQPYSTQMNRSHLFDPLLLLRLLIITVLILTERSPSVSAVVDPYFVNCSVPTTCGRHPIKFPFYIDRAYCGHPGFSVSCRNQTLFLTISGSQLIVNEIFYENQSIRVSIVADVGTEPRCFPRIRNFSVDGTNRFDLPRSQRQLFMLSSCNITSEPALSRYRADCAGEDASNSSLVLFGDDRAMENVSGICRSAVVSPVVAGEGYSGGGGGGGYWGLLRTGFVLDWVASDCSFCNETGGWCGFNHTNRHFMCFCPDRPHSLRCLDPAHPGFGTRHQKLVLLSIVVGIVVATLLTSLSVLLWFRRKKVKQSSLEIEALIKRQGTLAPKRYNYSEIKKITNSLKEKLGQGGFGAVYKGKLPTGHLVAVKVLKTSEGNGQDFINEVTNISKTSHVNVVTLLGYCLEAKKRALIYEFMPNGSLDKFIYSEKCSSLDEHFELGWESLFRIAIGIARGLEYLHNGCNTRIVHFDIKPHNILLDENLCPKISDFGLAKLCTRNDSIISLLDVRGTIGYIAPEVFNRNFGNISHKSDVYSYGMMVLEIARKRKNIDIGYSQTTEVYFPECIYRQIELDGELKLHGIKTIDDSEVAKKMMIVGLWCIQANPSERPPIIRVIEMLEGSVDVLQIPPKPYFSSPPREQLANCTTSSMSC